MSSFSATSDYDFCILTLCQPLVFRREVSPICLPERAGPVYNNKLSTVTGWGYISNRHNINSDEWDDTHVLMGVNVTTMENKKCQKSHKDNNICANCVFDNNICAKGRNKEDSCQGDSGGIFLCFNLCLTRTNLN